MYQAHPVLGRLAGGLLVVAALVACDGTNPAAVPNELQDRALVPASPQPIEVQIARVYSGLPARPAGTIDLDDTHVWVEILDVESYIPRSAAATDLRIGPSWDTGTPAADFRVHDLDNDGRRDIRLTFAVGHLVGAGHLGAQTTELQLWGRYGRSGQLFRGIAAVTVAPPEPAGGVVVGSVRNASNGFWAHGAAVHLVGTTHGTTTDQWGQFTLSGVPAGTYEMEVRQTGIIGRVIEGVVVVEAQTTDVGSILVWTASASWSYSPSPLRGRNGQRFTHHCTPGGNFHLVWGTDVYTDDSSVCVAAVHAGLITYASGGTVTFEIRAGQTGYTGSVRNGVPSGNWGTWPGSFVFPAQ